MVTSRCQWQPLDRLYELIKHDNISVDSCFAYAKEYSYIDIFTV